MGNRHVDAEKFRDFHQLLIDTSADAATGTAIGKTQELPFLLLSPLRAPPLPSRTQSQVNFETILHREGSFGPTGRN